MAPSGQEETDAGFQYMSGNLRKAAIQNSPVISRRAPKADGRITKQPPAISRWV